MTQYLLHVWTVPGYSDPLGVFAQLLCRIFPSERSSAAANLAFAISIPNTASITGSFR